MASFWTIPRSSFLCALLPTSCPAGHFSEEGARSLTEISHFLKGKKSRARAAAIDPTNEDERTYGKSRKLWESRRCCVVRQFLPSFLRSLVAPMKRGRERKLFSPFCLRVFLGNLLQQGDYFVVVVRIDLFCRRIVSPIVPTRFSCYSSYSVFPIFPDLKKKVLFPFSWTLRKILFSVTRTGAKSGWWPLLPISHFFCRTKRKKRFISSKVQFSVCRHVMGWWSSDKNGGGFFGEFVLPSSVECFYYYYYTWLGNCLFCCLGKERCRRSNWRHGFFSHLWFLNFLLRESVCWEAPSIKKNLLLPIIGKEGPLFMIDCDVSIDREIEFFWLYKLGHMWHVLIHFVMKSCNGSSSFKNIFFRK